MRFFIEHLSCCKYKLLLTASCMYIVVGSNAQTNKPTTLQQVPAVSSPVVVPPGYGHSPVINYVRTWEAMVRITDPAVINTSGYAEVKAATQYIDGLGRPLQTVIRQASPGSTPKDMVAPIVYDEFGRERYKFMPYVQTTGNTADGNLKLDPFHDQKNFYQNTYITQQPAYAGEQFFYGQADFESSPLNRVIKSYAHGNSWVGTGNGVSQHYLLNTIADDVRIWDITNNPLSYINNDIGTNIPVSRANPYSAGELFKQVTIDEHNNAEVEYKDKEERIILKKVQVGPIANDYSGYDGFLCTYFVYDDFGLLRFVIPPKLIPQLQVNGWNLAVDATAINELCFRYEYDEHQRMIAKKVPGAGWVYMIYDKRDRLVFTQDEKMRTSTSAYWMVNFFDELNRPTVKGLVFYTGGRVVLQDYVNTHSGNGTITNINAISSPSPNLTLTLRAVGVTLYKAAYNIDMEDGFDSEESAEFTTEFVDYYNDVNVPLAVTDNPVPAGSFLVVLTITHYDSYEWTNKAYTDSYNNALSSTSNGETLPANTETPLSISAQKLNSTRGMITGTEKRMLGPQESSYNLYRMLSSVNFYDDKGRIIQTHSDNHKDGTDINCNMYDFTGKVLRNYTVHSNIMAGVYNLKVLTKMNYDNAGRLLTTRKSVNNGQEALIVQNDYDIMSQLKQKKIGHKRNADDSYAAEYLETLDFTYNIRGWLKGINKDYVNTTSTNNRWFGMELSYDWGFGSSQFNGNIAGIKWRSAGDGEQRAYGFGYDKVNRLLYGDFSQATSNVYTDGASTNFDMRMGDGVDPASAYDENGNIKAMTHWGMKITGSGIIDNLSYTYNANSNKLKNVIDQSNDAFTKLGDFRTSDLSPNKNNRTISAVDYTYDVNGNMVKDLNKDIGTASANGILYNYLNLPRYITVQGATGEKGNIEYFYDATGVKLSKIVTETGTTTDYVAGMVYKNNVLQFIEQPEGRIRYKPANGTAPESFVYDYFIKDHVGNVRMVLTDEWQQAVYPVVTLEGDIALDGKPNAIHTENNYYSINNTYAVPKSQATGLDIDYANNNGNPPYNNNPNSNTETSSQKLYKLNGNTNKTGLGITLKVMSGDKINIFGKSYYFQNNVGGSGANASIPTIDLITGLLGTPTGAGSGKATVGDLSANNTITGALGDFINRTGRDDPNAPQKPKAAINWILLDDQFKFVTGNFSPVGPASQLTTHDNDLNIRNIPVTKNGYLYVYVSNESPVNVFFDNLQVIHDKGPILEETHYYPFGLTMAGISSKAFTPGNVENKYKYNGKEEQRNEFSDGGGLEWDDYKHRFYDHQIGRFFCQDRIADKFVYYSPYQFAGNKVPNAVDLDGLEPLDFRKYQTVIKSSPNNHNQEISLIFDPASIENGTSKTGYFTTMNYVNSSKMYYWKNNDGSPGLYDPNTAKDAKGHWTGYWQRYETAEQRNARVGSESVDMLSIAFFHLITAPFLGASKAGFLTKFTIDAITEFAFNGRDADVGDLIIGEIPYIGFILEAAIDYTPFADGVNPEFSTVFGDKGGEHFTTDILVGGAFKMINYAGKKSGTTITVNGRRATQAQMEHINNFFETMLNWQIQIARDKMKNEQNAN